MSRTIKLFGSLEILDNGRLSPLMTRSKGSALLAYLLITNQSQARTHIADLFWGDTDTHTALGNLRQLLHKIRHDAPELIATRQTIALELAPTTQVDYTAVRTALNQDDITQLDEGLQQVTGDLLATFYVEDSPYFNEWLTLTRERLRAEIMDAYHRLCTAYEEAQAWEAGINAARRWLMLDDLYEPTHRWLMRFLTANGQVAAARQQYESCRVRLWEELGVEPEAATQQLANQLEELARKKGGVLTAVSRWQPDPLPHPNTLPEPGLLPPHAILPYRRNPDFTGREVDLRQLGQWLLPWEEAKEIGDWRLEGSTNLQSPISTVAITGMGGLGKTQLAVEFAYRYGRFYAGGVYWVSFAEAENVAEEMAVIGGERGMQLYTEADKLTIADKVGRVQRAWQEPIPRLLIFDNCEDEALFSQWRPVSGGCRILLTSRRSEWVRDLGVAAHPLTTLARSESVKLLQRMTPHLLPKESHALDHIAADLGDLPLAIHLAGSFLHRYQRITPTRYLAQLEQLGPLQHPSLQGRGSDHSPTAHERNLARTFAFSLEQLDPTDETDAVARQLLERAACFAPGEPIPSSLLIATLQPDKGEERDLLAELLAEDGLSRLLSLGFLRQAEPQAVVMHRLLVRFTQLYLPTEAGRTAVCQTIVALCSQSLATTRAAYTLPITLTQVRHLIHTAAADETAIVAQLAFFLGGYLNRIADFSASQKYLEQALTLNQQLYGRYHTQVARCLNSLAALHMRSGDYQAAWTAFKEALTVYEAIYEPDHLHMRMLLSNIGYLLTHQGSCQQAKTYLERALPPHTEGDDDYSPADASCYNNLGVALLNLGELAAAQTYLERGLHLRQKVLAPDHPFMAVSLQNMGLLAIRQGDFVAAQNYLEMALSIRKQAVGYKHPHTARSLNALGELFLAQANYEQARAYFEQALAIQAEVFIAQHPEKAAPLKNLGEVYWAMGQREQARPFFEQARDILLKTAVSTHPDLPSIQQKLTAL